MSDNWYQEAVFMNCIFEPFVMVMGMETVIFSEPSANWIMSSL